jgi:hypothetical protein
MASLHKVDFELLEPRYIRVRFLGEMDGPEMQALMEAMEQSVGNEPYFLLEADVRAVKAVSAEARRIAAERFLRLPDRAIAMVGGGFAQRLFAKLVLTAVYMLSRNPRNASEYFQDSESARAWLRDYAARYEASNKR